MITKTWTRRAFITALVAIPLFFLILQYVDITPVYSADEQALKPRVPADKLAEVQSLKSPIVASEKTISTGKAIFHGKGVCVNCHGEAGNGKGPIANSFDHHPRDFTDTDDIGWQKARTDGEIFWAISKGTEYGMIPYEDMLSEDERWALVAYIRSLENSVVANHK
ncbi:MAG: cytochrome c [Nitrospirae bacterium]|nr:cytochrome c [Nitrospirota bacterium]